MWLLHLTTCARCMLGPSLDSLSFNTNQSNNRVGILCECNTSQCTTRVEIIYSSSHCHRQTQAIPWLGRLTAMTTILQGNHKPSNIPEHSAERHLHTRHNTQTEIDHDRGQSTGWAPLCINHLQHGNGQSGTLQFLRCTLKSIPSHLQSLQAGLRTVQALAWPNTRRN